MSQNGLPSVETAPLGENSSHFRVTLTGEIADATELPADKHVVGAFVLKHCFTSLGSQLSLAVNGEFVPPESEISLPAKTFLLEGHTRWFAPTQAARYENPSLFKFAVETRWQTCLRLRKLGREGLGGLVAFEDGSCGILFSDQLIDTANDVAQNIVNKFSPERTPDTTQVWQMIRDTPLLKTGVSEETVSATMRLIVACCTYSAAEFKQQLILPEQQNGRKAPVPRDFASSQTG